MRRSAALLLALGLLGSGAAGCTSVRNGLGPRVGICFSALPAARRLVGPKARLAGVRYLSPRSVARALARELGGSAPALPERLVAVVRKPMCLVGYKGEVRPAASRHAWRPLPGPATITIVMVRQADQAVLGVVELPKSPLRFSQL